VSCSTYGSETDLVADHVYDDMLTKASEYDIIFFLPVLVSFDTYFHDAGNAIRLRAEDGRHIYGVKPLSDRGAVELLRQDNLLVSKVHSMFRRLHAMGRCVSIISRISKKGRNGARALSPSDMPEHTKLKNEIKGFDSSVCMCYFDPDYKSMYNVLTNTECEISTVCVHHTGCEPRDLHWKIGAQESNHFVVTSKAITWMALRMILKVSATTSKVRRTAVEIGRSKLPKRMLTDCHDDGGLSQHLSARPRIHFETEVRGEIDRRKPIEILEADTIGGLRHSHKSVRKLSYGVEAGKLLAQKLDEYLNTEDGRTDADFLWSLFQGNKVTHTCPDNANCLECRVEQIGRVARTIVLSALADPQGTLPSGSDNIDTHLVPEVFEAWATASGDPDVEVSKWLRHGAPAGLSAMPKDCGIFPVELDDSVNHDGMMEYDPEDTSPYGQDADPEAAHVKEDEVKTLTDKGFLKKFVSYDDVVKYLGSKFIESKLFVIKQVKNGIVKLRVLLDCKKSGVSVSSQKCERVRLPRGLDVVFDALELSSCGATWVSRNEVRVMDTEDHDIEFAVLDVSDAFWSIPLAFEEQRFFVFRCGNHWYVVLRTAQGSRSAPLTWGRTFAMSARMAMSTSPPDRLRLETYVDDPIMIARGVPTIRRQILTRVILVWLAQGHRLAWHKAQSGASVSWISITFEITKDTVVAFIKTDLMNDILNLCTEIRSLNVYPLKRLRTLVGKVVHVAGLLHTWRPFVRMLWTPLVKDGDNAGAPVNCCWTKQLTIPVLWILAFLRGQHGTVKREFSIQSFLGAGEKISIVVDASPWGLGGVLTRDGTISEYFASPLSDHDQEIHSITRGDHRAQQCAEALALLVALRVWSKMWSDKRVLLHVRGDSVTALTLVLDMRAAGATMGLIAREVALDVAEAHYLPQVVSHLPGVSNVLADALSRLESPDPAKVLPKCLETVNQAICPPRDRKYYRTLTIQDNWNDPQSNTGSSGTSS